MNTIVEKIYSVLKRRRYNREKPFNENELKERIHSFVSKNNPITLVGFWGVGPKSHINWADEASCDFLNDLNKRVKEIYPPGVHFLFVFAEPHGEHNGIPKETIESYISDVKNLFGNYGFNHQHLQTLWNKYNINFEKIEKILKEKPEDWWNHIPNHKNIETNAQNRNQRMPAIDGAQRYVIMRDLEKEMWRKEFPTSIFHAFSDSKLCNVLPDMPTLYFFARKGWSDTPWFVTEEK